MSRAVLISCGGDVLLSTFVVMLWQKYWRDEVDRVYINFNTEMEEPTGEYLSRISTDKKISIIYHPYAIGFGEPIKQMLQSCRENLVMLLENDGFIFQTGIVDKYFKQIESGEFDALGSPRFSCGFEISKAMKVKYNLNYEGYGDIGPNFWPNFFFCKKEDLLKTDLNFAPKEFKHGEYVKEIDHTMSQTEASDTFGWTCMQLRSMGIRFGSIPQYHASPNEIEEYNQQINKWEKGKPPYIHGGSLSAGWSNSGFLLGRQPVPDNIHGMHEIETRVAFWQIVSDVVEGFDEFKKEYKQGIQNLIINGKLDEGFIRKKYLIYKQTMGI